MKYSCRQKIHQEIPASLCCWRSEKNGKIINPKGHRLQENDLSNSYICFHVAVLSSLCVSWWPWPLCVSMESPRQLSHAKDTPALLITMVHFLFDRKHPPCFNGHLWRGFFSRTVWSVLFVSLRGSALCLSYDVSFTEEWLMLQGRLNNMNMILLLVRVIKHSACVCVYAGGGRHGSDRE